ncbi:exported hypothetical protein [uncultured Desulfatiglans sp.]|uniref:Uncharacterized protein n=1 Tax=Uncultured Desulfatiglans sp. TaxID=1748965 RepID=A0A653A4G3_UNCDX|nr:exported hypothetical protein [uncultured Desulfatiglans sp.]
MQIEKRFLVHVGRLVVLLSMIPFLVLSSSPAAAGWLDDVKDELYMQEARLLEGSAFLDDPVSGGTIEVYDRHGFLLHRIDAATGENGSFSIALPLPESFTLVISKGEMLGRPFEHELTRYVHLFDPGKEYKVNAITSLLAAYLAEHPDIPYGEAKDAVRAFLSIPETIGLDEIIYSSEWYCYYFSHYAFMKEAEAVQGMEPFIEQLLRELEAGGIRCFFDPDSVGSSYFKEVMAALLKGAISKLGGEGTGWILGLLNIGGNDIDSRLGNMEKDLRGILSTLQNIITALTNLAHDLAMDTNEVETYIEGLSAQDAITLIKTHYGPEDPDSRGDTNTLKWYANCTSADSNPTTRADIERFVDNVNGAWDIESQVQKIHDAIIPDVGNTDGLLDLWTKNFLLQGPISPDDLLRYYQTLEQYFAVLLFYQFKGANIVVEALNYQSSSNGTSPVNGFGQDEVTPASSYLTGTFQPMIREQTDRFLQNVLKLVANNCGLYWEKNFLAENAQAVLARATFFITQTLGEDHYGLRLGVFGTENLIHDIKEIGAVRPIDEDTDQWVGTPGVLVDVEMPSRPYDYWGTLVNPALGTLKKGTTYSLLKGDLGPFDPGTYLAKYDTGDGAYPLLGNAVVKTYTEDYQEASNGTISYGYFLAPFRIGGKEAIMDPSAFKRNYYHNDHSGSVNWWHDENLYDTGLYLYVHGKNKYTNDSSSIDMKVEWYHPFTFEGTESTTAYLNIAGDITGSVYIHHENNWSNDAEIGYHIGIYDDTHNKIVKRIDDSFEASDNGNTQNYSKKLNDQISFTLEPGVKYYVYANIYGNGSNSSGDYEYVCKLNRLTHFSLTFVNSEFGTPMTVPKPIWLPKVGPAKILKFLHDRRK